MNRLLQSRRFKKNIKKWLLAYVTVLGFLTVVVTYSKYISSTVLVANTKPARFNIEFKNNTTCNESNKKCLTKRYRPYQSIDYNFSIDTSKTEVDTFLVINIDVDNEFKIEELKENDIDIKNLVEIEKNKITIKKNLKASDNSLFTYDIKIKYNLKENEDISKVELNNIEDIIKVGYSAIQDN